MLITTARADARYEQRAAYRALCRKNREPFIEIRKRRRYAALTIDLDPLYPLEFDEPTLDEIRGMLTPSITVPQYVTFARTLIRIHALPIGKAEDCARMLDAYLDGRIPRGKAAQHLLADKGPS